MSKLIKHEDFKVNLKEKLVLKAASLLFKTMCFSSKFVYVFYAKMGWQSTQQITIHPVFFLGNGKWLALKTGKITANADKLKITKQAAKISPAFVSTRPLKMNEVLFGRFPKYTVLKLWVRVKLLKRYDKFWNFLWNIKAIKSNLTCQQCVNIVLSCVCQIFGEICPEKYESGDSIICWWDPARFETLSG